MMNPFYSAANRVIRMYQLRQEMVSHKAPANSPSEVSSACSMLKFIATAAAYAGSKEALFIRLVVDIWEDEGKVPDFFPGDE